MLYLSKQPIFKDLLFNDVVQIILHLQDNIEDSKLFLKSECYFLTYYTTMLNVANVFRIEASQIFGSFEYFCLCIFIFFQITVLFSIST